MCLTLPRLDATLLCKVRKHYPFGSRHMELRDALCQISEIRQQMARSEIFQGYRSTTVALSGGLALLAAACQPWMVGPAAANDLDRYLMLWTGVAAVSLAAAALQIGWRSFAADGGLSRQMACLAAEQFLPCVAVGAILTLGVYHGAREVAWMLPGLWSLIFSLGIFASSRLLPRQVVWVAGYYVVCGLGCLLWGKGLHALSPWLMAISFGGGQLLGAVILHWTLERTDGTQT